MRPLRVATGQGSMSPAIGGPKRMEEPLSRITRLAMAVLGSMLAATAAFAQGAEIRLSRTTTMAYLPLFVVEHEKLLQKHAAAMGIPDLKVTVLNFTGPSAQIDALLSGNVDIVATGATSMITLWARTKGTPLEVKGLSAMSSMPMGLNTRNPNVKSIADLTDADRIAVPSVKVSFNAMLLQMAAAKQWGMQNFAKLDHLTVGLGQMDAVAAMMSPRHEVNSDFATPPFLYIERELPNVRTVITLKDILGEKGTIGTTSTSSRFFKAQPKLVAAYRAAISEAMEIIANDKPRAVDGYIAATGDRKTDREMLIRIISDPDAEFTATPRSMKAYADFMRETGSIKIKPDSWKDMFFEGIEQLPGS